MLDPRVECETPERLRDRQWRRFRALVGEVFGANPFWTSRWRAAGFSSANDLRGWEDFLRLPLTCKADFLEDQTPETPFGSNLTYPLDRYVRVHQTSGTGGQPIRWLDTQASWDWWVHCWTFVLAAAGIRPGDRVYFPFSFGLFIGFWAGFEGARALGALAIPGGGHDSIARLATMQSFGVNALVCTPSHALRLLDVAREGGIDLTRFGVRTTVHAGEPGAGIPAVRERIERGWGARAFDHAGMTEVGAYGYECSGQAGLHVNESEFIAEVVDPVTLAPAVEGELVVTNLGRMGSPAIRYRTGDRVRLANGGCACGRTFRRLEGGILGRLDDMLFIRGVNVFPSAVEAIVRRFPVVTEFRIEVSRERDLQHARVVIEVEDGTGETGPVREAVQQALRAGLGVRLDVACVEPGALPRWELKARRVVWTG